MHGEEAARQFDPKGEYAGVLGKAMKAIQDHLSEQPNFLAQYQEEARAGKEIIAVAVKDESKVSAVSETLQRHGARNIRYFGALAVRDLSPESNPSRQSAESPEPKSDH
jgi:hypothetical protein